MTEAVDEVDDGFPRLQDQTTGPPLSFPWAEFIGEHGSTFNASMGHGGVNSTMQMLIYWEDLAEAAQGLLGYSRNIEGRLNRVLPWLHPIWDQMWVTRIASAVGVQFTGKGSGQDMSGIKGSGSPCADYNCVILTLQFNRPPYAIYSDSQIKNSQGVQEEWLRFTDRQWTPSVSVLSREGQQFYFSQGAAANQGFGGSVGFPLCKMGLTRRWYQLPQTAILTDEPDGFPTNLVTAITSPVSLATLLAETPPIFPPNQVPLGGTTLGSVNLYPFFGCPPGTLLYEVPEILPQPLPLPPELMFLSNNFQLQYDIVFHFTYFDPPQGVNTNMRGHNLMPWAKDALWYPVCNTNTNTAVASGSANYPFQAYDHSQLWTIIDPTNAAG